MGPDVIIGLLSGVLLGSLAVNTAQFFFNRSRGKLWRFEVTRAEDARRAAELRSEQQIDAMLARISTSPRIEVRPATPPPDPAGQHYISDEPYHDDLWNDIRGGDDEELPE